jgi:hypothetical protein
MRATTLSIFSALALASISVSRAQSPAPVVVPAMTPAATTQSAAATAVTSAANQTALKALQAMKAANDELLRQQAATLLKLDEMEKAANEIRIFTKRS